jgi:hypothetical protein
MTTEYVTTAQFNAFYIQLTDLAGTIEKLAQARNAPVKFSYVVVDQNAEFVSQETFRGAMRLYNDMVAAVDALERAKK